MSERKYFRGGWRIQSKEIYKKVREIRGEDNELY